MAQPTGLKHNTTEYDGIQTRDVPVTELKVGDVVVSTTSFRGQLVTTISTITTIGHLQDVPDFATYRHFRSDMVTGDGWLNPDHGFMMDVTKTARVQA